MALLNGRLPAAMLKTIDSHTRAFGVTRRAQPAAAHSFDRLDAAFHKRFGKHIYITDSYRTYGEQVAVKKAKPFLAAKPGTSNHGWGLALDLGSSINIRSTAEHKWMASEGRAFGWINPTWAVPGALGFQKDEPWHFEYVRSLDTKRVKNLAIIPRMNRTAYKRWQQQLGVTADGIFGAGSNERLQRVLNGKDGHGGFSLTRPLAVDGIAGARTWMAVQKLINVWAKRGDISLKRPLAVTGRLDARTAMALRKTINANLWE